MSDDTAVASAENNVATPTEKKSRTSMVSRATAEGEALLKEMGFEDKETPGRRRTRAAIRGEVYAPPAKKERKSTGARRGRPPKKAVKKAEPENEEEKEEEKKEDEEKEPSAAEDSADGEAEETKSE